MQNKIKLEAEETVRILDDAVAAHCQIVIEFASAPGRTVNGTILSGDKKTLLVQVTGNPAFEWSKFAGVRCEARIYHDRRYSADTKVLDLPSWGETQGVTLAKPARIAVMDRRRFLRAKLAPSSKVELQWKVGGAEHTRSVSLLNVSADGMACRVDDAMTSGLEKRQRLRARFSLPGEQRQIELEARVTNLTPASVGASIMGLQFTSSKDDAESIRALRVAIERAESGALDEEVHA
ncbi:MAG TPA: PilZ domain-containing protein [Phycisphaerae bacterium]|nr:PilZ domain-containing protein [Phycisphaerae bacterium]HRW52036.1 PilZ domain-containing protein [Phycisphaerae bacterium]